MHQYVEKNLVQAGALEAALAADRAGLEAALTRPECWGPVCALANACTYAGEYRWVAEVAAEVKVILAQARAAANPPKPEPAWKAEPATPKQVAALKHLNYRGATATLTKGEASRLLFRAKRNKDKAEECYEVGAEQSRWYEEQLYEVGREIEADLFGHY